MGATVALPFLDAMVAAKGIGAPAAAAERTRFLAIEEVHGLPGCNKWGATKYLFAPEQVGRDFTIVPDSALSVARAVSQAPDHRVEHRRAHGRGVHGA